MTEITRGNTDVAALIDDTDDEVAEAFRQFRAKAGVDLGAFVDGDTVIVFPAGQYATLPARKGAKNPAKAKTNDKPVDPQAAKEAGSPQTADRNTTVNSGNTKTKDE